MRAWSAITGWRFESSSAHLRKPRRGGAFVGSQATRADAALPLDIGGKARRVGRIDMGASRSDRPRIRPRKGLFPLPPPAGSHLRRRCVTQLRREAQRSRRKDSSCAAPRCIRMGARRCCKPDSPATWSRSRVSTARAFTASLPPGTTRNDSCPWPLSLSGTLAEAVRAEMRRTTPLDGAVAADALRHVMGVASSSAMKDSALSERCEG